LFDDFVLTYVEHVVGRLVSEVNYVSNDVEKPKKNDEDGSAAYYDTHSNWESIWTVLEENVFGSGLKIILFVIAAWKTPRRVGYVSQLVCIINWRSWKGRQRCYAFIHSSIILVEVLLVETVNCHHSWIIFGAWSSQFDFLKDVFAFLIRRNIAFVVKLAEIVLAKLDVGNWIASARNEVQSVSISAVQRQTSLGSP